MDTLSHILHGFNVALMPINLWYTFLGCFMGTIIGILPGIGPAAGIGLLIPITFGMDPTSALIMMAGIYYGAAYTEAINYKDQNVFVVGGANSAAQGALYLSRFACKVTATWWCIKQTPNNRCGMRGHRGAGCIRARIYRRHT